MRILVTNDDGYFAPGIAALANALIGAGHEVTIAAPSREQSGGGAGLGRVIDGHPIECKEFELAEIPGLARGIAIGAPPALIVKAVLGPCFGLKPDIVLSGINLGWNTGPTVIHSGTIGAAMTACVLGLKAAAISCGPGEDNFLETSATLGPSLAKLLYEWPEPVALNVNVPALPRHAVKGAVPTRIANGTLMDVGVVRDGENLRFSIDRFDPEDVAGSDASAVSAGNVSITAFSGGYAQCARADHHHAFANAMVECIQSL